MPPDAPSTATLTDEEEVAWMDRTQEEAEEARETTAGEDRADLRADANNIVP